MINFCSLYSGSSGNSLFVETDNTKLLIDAGVSCKKIETALNNIEVDPNSIDGILVTHEHIDHVQGLGTLSRKFDLPVFVNQETLDAMPKQKDKILDKNEFIKVNKDENYKSLVERLDVKQIEGSMQMPSLLKANLREYQKIGVQWLQMLDFYGLGGILADDMGLGKTVQILCVICSYLEKHKENSKPIMVVCPSSLCLNWQNEIEKFTTGVTSQVIHGSLEARKKQIENIKISRSGQSKNRSG